ncbi:hypothetical protein BH18ACT15_BH18ACT15_12630 [soil metagenome]
MLSIRVDLPGPFDLAGSLEYLRRNGDDLIDRWDGATLVRMLPVGERCRPLAMTTVGDLDTPRFLVETPVALGETIDESALSSSVAAQFVTAHDALADLAAKDAVIDSLVRRHRGIGVLLQPHLLHALIRSISAQQVNLAWATVTRARLVELVGTRYPVGSHAAYAIDPDRLAGTSVGALRALQFTTAKAEYIITVARAIVDGVLDIPTLAQAEDAEVIARLTSLRGIGRWSAEWFLVRSLGRARVVGGDLGVRKAVGFAYNHQEVPSEAETRRLTAQWGPAAPVAQQLVLEAHAARGRNDEAPVTRSASAGSR